MGRRTRMLVAAGLGLLTGVLASTTPRELPYPGAPGGRRPAASRLDGTGTGTAARPLHLRALMRTATGTTGTGTTGTGTLPGPGPGPGPGPANATPAAPATAPRRGRPAPAVDAAACPRTNGQVMRAAPGRGRTVALTFDDGPGPDTARVLDILAAQRVHATFFVVGEQVTQDRATVRRAARQGHLIANHTWDHRYPRAVRGGWTTAYLTGQITRTDAAIASVTGTHPCFFRPPGGHLPSSVPAGTAALRQRVAMWSVDPQDWAIQTLAPGTAAQADAMRQRIYTRAIAGTAQPHPIVLLHDGGGYRAATAAALPQIIAYYRAHGYRFVRLDGRT